MISRISATPSFQSYVNIKQDKMTEEQKKVVNSETFQYFADDLRNNGRPGIVRISAGEDKDHLSMDIVGMTFDDFNDKPATSVFNHSLHLSQADLDMTNLYFLYSGGYIDFDKDGKCATGGTLKMSEEPYINYMK